MAVTTGVCAAEAEAQNARFLTAARRGRPFVLLKAALTLDGRIATASGDSKWITSPAQRLQARAAPPARRRARGHRHRRERRPVAAAAAPHAATLHARGPRHPPEIACDEPSRRLGEPAEPLLVVCGEAPLQRRRRALEACGVTVVEVAKSGNRVVPARALEALFECGLASVTVEGGSEVLGSFLAFRCA